MEDRLARYEACLGKVEDELGRRGMTLVSVSESGWALMRYTRDGVMFQVLVTALDYTSERALVLSILRAGYSCRRRIAIGTRKRK